MHKFTVEKRYDGREEPYWVTVCSCGDFVKNGVADMSSVFHVLESMGVAEFDPQLLTGVQYKTMDRGNGR